MREIKYVKDEKLITDEYVQKLHNYILENQETFFLKGNEADHWRDFNDKSGGTLPTLTRSRQLQTSGALQGSYYFTRLATNGAGTSLGASSLGIMNQPIENGVRNLCGDGKKVTVSFWAKSDIANKRLCLSLNQNYGNGI